MDILETLALILKKTLSSVARIGSEYSVEVKISKLIESIWNVAGRELGVNISLIVNICQ